MSKIKQNKIYKKNPTKMEIQKEKESICLCIIKMSNNLTYYGLFSKATILQFAALF